MATDLTRRQFGWAFGATSFALTGMAGQTMASDLSRLHDATLEQNLQSALRSIGSDAAIDAADDLARVGKGAGGISFHMRRSKLTLDHTALIARALTLLSDQERARLGSFSLSYNDIGDQGAQVLAAALPETLSDLGLVGCSIGDKGGEAVLRWARRASGLRMICIESNALSKGLRDQFSALRSGPGSVAVFV